MIRGIVAALLVSSAAQAVDWQARLEVGPAFAVSRPQSRLFDAGGVIGVRGGIAPLKFLDVSLVLQFTGQHPSRSNPDSSVGTAWFIGANARLRMPRTLAVRYSPWVDIELGYTATGPLSRFGYSIGAGLAIPGGQRARFWYGPFFRYQQIVDPDSSGHDSSDAKLILVGFSFELGAARGGTR